MALIPCAECGNSISEFAKTCPCCGFPMEPLVIEQTAKPIKAMILIAFSISMLGAAAYFWGLYGGGETPTHYGAAGFLGGLFSMVVFKLAAYWKNG